MPFAEQFSQYENEADFRDRMLIPLISRLGYSMVVNYHGQREFGRDIVFGEIDRFGHVQYSAMQVKFEPSLGQATSHGLIADARESFGHKFHHPQRGTQEYVSRFYLVNAGSIATNCRDNFFTLLEPPIAANSILLDGRGVVALDRIAGLTHDSMVRQTITGVIAELNVNDSCNLRQHLKDYLVDQTWPMQRLRVVAVSGMLQRPVVPDATLLQAMQSYWHYATTINSLIDSADTPLNVPDMKRIRIETAIETFKKLNMLSRQIHDSLNTLVVTLGSPLV